ncbi:MAG TPA: response regulator [Allosphingosinicella sp.]|nr:response regulator [Allosphingosinicella sp.]
MHALIIEDQFLIAALIEDVLSGFGYTSFDVVDGESEAIRAAAARCPDLITADQRLAEGGGVEAVRIICAERDIPVVFISEYGDQVRALAPEAVLIGKPFNERIMRAAVDQASELVGRATAAAG